MPRKFNAKADLGSLMSRSNVWDIDNVYLSDRGWVYRHYTNDAKSEYWDEIIVPGEVPSGDTPDAWTLGAGGGYVPPTSPTFLNELTGPGFEFLSDDTQAPYTTGTFTIRFQGGDFVKGDDLDLAVEHDTEGYTGLTYSWSSDGTNDVFSTTTAVSTVVTWGDFGPRTITCDVNWSNDPAGGGPGSKTVTFDAIVTDSTTTVSIGNLTITPSTGTQIASVGAQYTASIDGNAPNPVYYWDSLDGAVSFSDQHVANPTITISPTVAGTKTYTIACAVNDSSVNDGPELVEATIDIDVETQRIGTVDILEQDGVAGGAAGVGQVYEAEITAPSSNPITDTSLLEYTWTAVSGVITAGADTATPTIEFPNAGTYVVSCVVSHPSAEFAVDSQPFSVTIT